MNASLILPREFPLACQRHGVVPTRYVFTVKIGTQSARLFQRSFDPYSESRFPGYGLVRKYRCSTSRFGIGSEAGSNCTPLGLHRVAEKVGGGWPVGAVFRSRKLVGFTWQGVRKAPITNRIFWLEGMEPGLNRGGKVDTHARYVYIHGTGNELTLGKPASHGCIHLSGQDLLPLYDFLPSGTLVWIER